VPVRRKITPIVRSNALVSRESPRTVRKRLKQRNGKIPARARRRRRRERKRARQAMYKYAGPRARSEASDGPVCALRPWLSGRKLPSRRSSQTSMPHALRSSARNCVRLTYRRTRADGQRPSARCTRPSASRLAHTSVAMKKWPIDTGECHLSTCMRRSKSMRRCGHRHGVPC
jgi:hypothetical protein